LTRIDLNFLNSSNFSASFELLEVAPHAFEPYDLLQFVSDRPGDYTLPDGRFVQLVHTVDERMARALHQFYVFDSWIEI